MNDAVVFKRKDVVTEYLTAHKQLWEKGGWITGLFPSNKSSAPQVLYLIKGHKLSDPLWLELRFIGLKPIPVSFKFPMRLNGPFYVYISLHRFTISYIPDK